MEKKSRKPLFFIALACVLILCTVIYIKYSMAPISFPVGSLVNIEKGENIANFATQLKKSGHISSTFLFKTWLYIFGQNKIVAGNYYIPNKESSFSLAERFSNGDYGMEDVRIVIPEGSTAEDIAWIFLKNTKGFDAPLFLSKAHKLEGYLFPDTYLVSPFITPDEAVKILNNEFKEKIEKVRKEITQGESVILDKKLNEVIVLASILEKEANDAESRRIIAGILWKRTENGWPLQVDATLGYITGKTSAEMTATDLKIDSPYNTYKYRGIPKFAISNPGYDAILATIKPTESPYWFYLTDNDGKMHYAKNLDEHNVNRVKYLGK